MKLYFELSINIKGEILDLNVFALFQEVYEEHENASDEEPDVDDIDLDNKVGIDKRSYA